VKTETKSMKRVQRVQYETYRDNAQRQFVILHWATTAGDCYAHWRVARRLRDRQA